MAVSKMSAHHEPETDELSVLEQQYRVELPQILITADSDLDAALAALDRYLDQAPPRGFQKALLAWKGRLYLEHGKYDDAARELRTADGLQIKDDLKNFNTKFDLAKALEGGGDPRGAYSVLTAALNEVEEPPLLLKLLPALVRVTASSGRPMPPRAEAALSRAKQFYGLDHPPEADLPAETARLAELVHDASVRFTRLHQALSRAKSAAKRVSLVEKYLRGVTVPYFKERAEELLHRVREGTAHEK